jgi:hypothetical protein
MSQGRWKDREMTGLLGIRSSPRKRGPSLFATFWIPACAEMSEKWFALIESRARFDSDNKE